MGKKSPHVLMLFLDGVGIGKKDASVNPFFAANLKSLRSLLDGKLPHLRDAHHSNSLSSLVPINATLGVEGLPQSGTGQTALMIGMNAAKFIGKHFGPYPYSTLKPIIQEQNIFKVLSDKGKKVFYANAFPPKYFEYINSTKMRMTAITCSWVSSGFALNTHEILAHGEALSADITSQRWNAQGFPTVSELTPQEAGKRLARFSDEYDFTLFEFYYTDHIGHHQSMPQAIEVLELLDALLEGIINHFDAERNLFFLTSDHGNLEDLSTKTHTRNPVPLFVYGKLHKQLTSSVKNLTHVVPALLDIMG
ncbi:MAG: alkaline phosphatase family protein [Ignavibacteriae bacterium]|nr:alkaline phosphatase family protein [Ignavibacteriota bacterium]